MNTDQTPWPVYVAVLFAGVVAPFLFPAYTTQIAFLWLMIAAVRLACRSHAEQDGFPSVLSLAILTALVGFLSLGLLNENFRDSEGILQVWFLLGLLCALPRLSTEPLPKPA